MTEKQTAKEKTDIVTVNAPLYKNLASEIFTSAAALFLSCPAAAIQGNIFLVPLKRFYPRYIVQYAARPYNVGVRYFGVVIDGEQDFSLADAGTYTFVFDYYMPSDYVYGWFRIVHNMSGVDDLTITAVKGSLQKDCVAQLEVPDGKTFSSVMKGFVDFEPVYRTVNPAHPVSGKLILQENFEDVADDTVIFNAADQGGILPAYKNSYIATPNLSEEAAILRISCSASTAAARSIPRMSHPRPTAMLCVCG